MQQPAIKAIPVSEHKRSRLDLESLLRPKAVAVVGANDKIASFSGGSVYNLLRHRYEGQIYPVNPGRSEVQGLRCFPSLDVLPGRIDSVVIVTRADSVLDNIRHAVAAGAKSALVVSSGIGEGASGAEGARRKDQMLQLIAETGVTVLGPNSIGLVNLLDAYVPRSNSNQLEPQHVRPGPIALFTQSGAGNKVVYNRAQAAGVGIGISVATGVQLGVTVWDLVNYAVDDGRIEVICLMVEGLGPSMDYVPALERAHGAGKPVVLLRAGRSAVGSAAAQTHSGALAGNWEVERSLLSEVGVTLVDDIDQLWEVASLFRWWDRAPRRTLSLGAFALSGGEAALLADQASDEGFSLPPVSTSFGEVARAHFPLAGIGNPFDPVDMLTKPDAGLAAYGAFVDQNDFDVYVCAMHMQSERLMRAPLQEFSRPGKRVAVTWWPVPHLTDDVVPLLFNFPGPVFAGSPRFVKALQKWSLSSLVEVPAGTRQSGVDAHALSLAVPRDKELTYWEAGELLSKVGIPFATARCARRVGEAVDAAETIGFPVVMKADVPCSTHKAAAGLVVLGVNNRASAAKAYQALAVHSEGRVVVEQFVSGFLQLFAGISQDKDIGAVLIFGAGGSAAEFMRDVALLPCGKVNAASVGRMISNTAAGRFLGQRYPQIAEQVAHVLVKLSTAAQSYGATVDVNPLVVTLNPPVVIGIDTRIVGASDV